MSSRPRFHLAFPVTDLEATRVFYRDVLGCRVGREAERWIDFDFCEHQISAHLVDDELGPAATNLVDGHGVPTRHFGLILPWNEWEAMVARLRESEIAFLIEPHVRFEGQPGEQATAFVLDPSGNGLEFKAFLHPDDVFAT